MINLIMNIIFGIVFEIFFITIMLCKIKDIKEKRILLFLGVTFTYIISGAITKFCYLNQYLFYIVFNIVLYAYMKILYKRKVSIIDFFFIYYIGMIINLTSIISILILKYNYFSCILNRLMLILVIIFSSKIKLLYKFYLKYWNRKKDAKVKSITIRNFSIMAMNLLLYFVNYYIINYFIKLI